jgi:AcrR family transcriptional regulator
MPVPPRRTYLRADERRTRIVDGALEMLAGKDCDEGSIADVCSQGRIEPGTLNRYFNDKRAVLGGTSLIARIVPDIAVLLTCDLIGGAHHQTVPR